MSKFVELLVKFNENHKRISDECYLDGQTKKKTSKFVMDQLKKEFPDLDCAGKSEEPCIRELIQDESTVKTVPQIIDEIIKLYPVLYRNPNTLKQWLSEAKTTIDKKFKANPAILAHAQEVLHVDPIMKAQIQKSASDRVVKTNTQSITFDAAQVFEIIKKLSKAQNWPDRAVAVALAVGCRQIEMFKVSEFEKIPEEPNWVLVKGVAKDRQVKRRKAQAEKEGFDSPPSARVIKKPILILTADELVSNVEFIRKQSAEEYKLDWQTQDNKEIANRTNHKLNSAIRHAFGRDDITFHRITRALYARITYDTYNTDTKMQLTAWISTVLGHQVNSIETGLSYQAVNVTYPLKTTHPNIEHKLTELATDLRLLHDEIQHQKRRPHSDLLAWDQDRHRVLMHVHTTNGTQKAVVMPRHKRTKALPPGQAIEKYVVDNFDKHLFIPTRKLLLAAGFGNKTVTDYFKTHWHPRQQLNPKRQKLS